eukprot:UN03072
MHFNYYSHQSSSKSTKYIFKHGNRIQLKQIFNFSLIRIIRKDI